MKSILTWALCLIATCSQAMAANVVSIYQLLGNPERYDGRKLVVSGVIGVVNGKMVSIFPDLESRQNEITINSVLLAGEFGDGSVGKLSAADVARLDGKYVTVWGTFGYSDTSNRLYTGGIRAVTDIQKFVKFPLYSTKVPDGK